MSVFDLSDVYLWLDGKGGAEQEKGGREFWAKIGENPHLRETLVTIFDNAGDWTVWERHPQGDEVLVALSGAVTVVIEGLDGVEQRHPMQSGDALVIPAGCWHTADVQAPGRMLFLTYGEGTTHRPRQGVR